MMPLTRLAEWQVHQAFGATKIGKGRQRPIPFNISPIAFGEMNGSRVYNASDVVPVADSRFLFCDNNTSDALFELDLEPNGQKKGLLIKRPLRGLSADVIDDLEGMTLVQEGAQRFIFITSSLSLKERTADGKADIRRAGLLRVKVNPDGNLTAENIPGFRDLFLQNVPSLSTSSGRTPDEDGLNIEGLAWDPRRHALLFGLRTPLDAGKPLLIPVRIKKSDGPWTTGNLEFLQPIRLSPDTDEGEQGVRSIQYVAARKSFLVILGKTKSGIKVPFSLHEWDGGQGGKMRRLNVSFAAKMKPEGVTAGAIGGKPVLLFVDDDGGYQVLWLATTRL
jgi:hypothetical protein